MKTEKAVVKDLFRRVRDCNRLVEQYTTQRLIIETQMIAEGIFTDFPSYQKAYTEWEQDQQ